MYGLPVVATAGIGDTEAISADAGMLLQRMDDADLRSRWHPCFLMCMILLAFIQQGFSQQALSLVKFGKYFLCGVPVVTTAGVGNSDSISI